MKEASIRQGSRVLSVIAEMDPEPTVDELQGVIANSDILEMIIRAGENKLKQVDRDELRKLIDAQGEGPTLNADGSITIRLKVDGDKTDEQCVAEAKAAGWSVNSNIKSDRRVKVKNQSRQKGIYEVTVTLEKIVPSGSVWKKVKVTSALGADGLDMDLHILVALIPFRDQLRKLGVNWIFGWGARFRDSGGAPCVACLRLGNRCVYLIWLECDRYDSDWFGSVGK